MIWWILTIAGFVLLVVALVWGYLRGDKPVYYSEKCECGLWVHWEGTEAPVRTIRPCTHGMRGKI